MKGYNYVLVISMILSSFAALLCRGGPIKNTVSNFRTGKDLINDRATGRLKEAALSVGSSDLNSFEETPEILAEKPENRYEKVAPESKEIDRRFRQKREFRNEVNNNRKSSEARSDRKRSANKISEKTVSKVDEDQRKVDESESLDYDDLSGDQSSQELKDTDYSEDVDDDSTSAKKMADNKRTDSRVVREDTDKFIDQDERSSSYDDFEAKDVVKRGISGAEDYEEVEEDDDTSGALDDAAAVQEEDEEEVRGDARVKREHGDNSKAENQLENIEVSVKEGDPLIESNEGKSVDDKAAKRDADKSDESAQAIQDKSASKNENEVAQDSKRDIIDKQENEELKVNSEKVDTSKELPVTNDKSEVESAVSKSTKDENFEVQSDSKRLESAEESSDKKLVPDLLEQNGGAKSDDPKVADALNLNDASKIQDVPVSNDAPKVDDSKSEAAKEIDANYEKRVEEEIQRKIDAIKEDIKREIEETQRIREIEKNNARFDELRNQDDDDEDSEQSSEGERIEKRQSVKRPVRSPDSSRVRDNDQNKNRPIKRKKRQENVNVERNKNSLAALNGKSQFNHESVKKRSTQFRRNKMQKRMAAQSAPIKKKEYVRRAVLVKNENGGGKKRKRRRRRARNLNLIPEQGRVKIQEKMAPEVNLDPGLRKVLGDGKQSSSSLNVGDEKSEAEQNSRRKSDLTAPLTGSSQELNPRLANDYKEAFGGHQGESGVALARFKRIKRVLRAPSTKT